MIDILLILFLLLVVVPFALVCIIKLYDEDPVSDWTEWINEQEDEARITRELNEKFRPKK